ncbi:hypothetical protein C1T31_12270 [Hanstruepera neustonica]|uniref:DUF4179 domain-containing protein n=2 Tax=Hanstruepera neustonica TaxID=1445657 RepID=A0A2K1DWG6_9FLAO|nr:hypothetical protein C1T31_12270 [Hanstruepera neustonica]
MMSDDLENLFKDLEGHFDSEEPNKNHERRFLTKLNEQNSIAQKTTKQRFNWKPLIGIAASVILIVALVIGNNQEANATGLASVSPEMAQTQDFFTSTIAVELKKLENAKNPETKLLIQDALNQMKRLELEYDSLISDLKQSGNDQRVIYAMISNFQNRIEILQNTLKQIEIVEQLKKQQQ